MLRKPALLLIAFPLLLSIPIAILNGETVFECRSEGYSTHSIFYIPAGG